MENQPSKLDMMINFSHRIKKNKFRLIACISTWGLFIETPDGTLYIDRYNHSHGTNHIICL